MSPVDVRCRKVGENRGRYGSVSIGFSRFYDRQEYLYMENLSIPLQTKV